jgi:two-component system cell cycle response regulator CpdR
MQETIKWLLNIERLAEAFYKQVSVAFKEDKEISEFFYLLAKEEAWHLTVMKKGLKSLPNLKAGESPVLVDDATRKKIEDVFTTGGELLASGGLDRDGLLDCLVTAEFSEWNDIFIYVVNSLKEEGLEFASAAAKIQRHVKEVERFLEDLPEGKKHLHVIKCLPPVWNEKILIVEDEEPVLELLKAVLKHEGVIETARDGEEAFAKLKGAYFDAVVSGVGLPGMDGVELYRKAVELDPGISSRYLFIADSADEYLPFFASSDLRHLLKPAPIKEIKSHVDEILHKTKKKP